MDRKIKSEMLRPLIVLEHLYLETNEDNPVTLEDLINVLNEQGFAVRIETMRGWMRMFINEMEYPIGKVRMKRIGAPMGYYWKV